MLDHLKTKEILTLGFKFKVLTLKSPNVISLRVQSPDVTIPSANCPKQTITKELLRKKLQPNLSPIINTPNMKKFSRIYLGFNS